MDKNILKEYKLFIEQNKKSLFYQNNIRNFLRFCDKYGVDILNPDPQYFKDYGWWLKHNHYSPGMINSCILTLRQFYNFLWVKGLVPFSLYKSTYDVKMKANYTKKDDFISIKELDKIISRSVIFLEKKSPKEFKALLYFMYYTGIKLNELYKLKRNDVDLTRCSVKLKNREIFFPQKVKNMLMEYFSSIPEGKNAFNFSEYDNKTYTEIFYKFSPPRKKMSLKNLRNSCISLFMRKKVGYETIRYLLDITKSEMEKYYKPNLKQIEKIYKRKIK